LWSGDAGDADGDIEQRDMCGVGVDFSSSTPEPEQRSWTPPMYQAARSGCTAQNLISTPILL
jgi:hypothetical protein